MKGVILAAGNGSRMRAITDRPKCLLEVDGESLLRRQIRALNLYGVHDIVVVTGYESARIHAHCGGLEFVYNPMYRSTNSLHSLWLARAHLADGFVVLNADVLFHTALLSDLLRSPHGAALLISFVRDAHESLGAEEMKVRVSDSLVRDISKEMDPRDADGENVGIAKFCAAESALLLTHLERLVGSGASDEWAPRAFQSFALQHPLHAVPTNSNPWIEIDTPDDYETALGRVAPCLDSCR